MEITPNRRGSPMVLFKELVGVRVKRLGASMNASFMCSLEADCDVCSRPIHNSGVPYFVARAAQHEHGSRYTGETLRKI